MEGYMVSNGETDSIGAANEYKLMDDITPEQAVVHRANLVALKRMVNGAFSEKALFSDPTGRSDKLYTFEAIMGFCSGPIAGMIPEDSFETFQEHFVSDGAS